MGVLVVAVLLPTDPAQADAIDGDWCYKDGKNLSIRGPSIVTPAGTSMQGNYARHHFSYVVPSAESNAGSTISMVLVSDDLLHLSKGNTPGVPADGPVQIWERCSLNMS